MTGIIHCSLFRQYLTALVLLSIMTMATACGGASGTLSEDSPGQSPAATDLPDPATIDHSTSMVEGVSGQAGSAFRSDLLVQHVTADADMAVFLPGDAADKLPAAISGYGLDRAALVIYTFDTSALLGESGCTLSLRCDVLPLDSEVVAYAGIANRAEHQWDWQKLAYTEDSPEGPRLSGIIPAGMPGPWLDVVIVVYGDSELRVDYAAITPPAQLNGGTVAFRKGWDGTVKDTSGHCTCVCRDADGRMHITYYDDEAGQLYHLWQDGDAWLTRAVACDGISGSSHDLVSTPAGGLLLVLYDSAAGTGNVRWMTPEALADGVWTAGEDFETGLDDGGLAINAGANCRAVFDSEGNPHVFYEDVTNQRVRHAWRQLGGPWVREYVSQEGVPAGQPIGLNSSAGLACVYRQGGALYLAQPGADGWAADLLADDLVNPLDPTAETMFFDAVIRDSTAVLAMACTSGERIIHRDLATRTNLLDDVQGIPGDGAFPRLALLPDNGVALAGYDHLVGRLRLRLRKLEVESGYETIPVLAIGGPEYPDQDCDGFSLWVDPVAGTGGWHDVFLGVYGTKPKGDTADPPRVKKTFTGHVTLLKQ